MLEGPKGRAEKGSVVPSLLRYSMHLTSTRGMPLGERLVASAREPPKTYVSI